MQSSKQKYTLIYKQFGVVNQSIVEGETLQDALTNLLKQCMKEDNTGIFFELENADVNYLKTKENFHIVKDDTFEYGILLEDYSVES